MEALPRTPDPDAESSDLAWDTPDLRLLVRQKGEQPPFPMEVLPAFWRDWCRGAAAGVGAPVDYVSLALLTAGAGLIGAGRYVSPVPVWVEPCVLWTALVGASGSGNTPGMQAVLRLVRALDRELAANGAKPRQDGCGPEVVCADDRPRLDAPGVIASSMPSSDQLPAARVPQPVTHRQLITDDPAIEAVAEAMKVNARGILLACDPLEDWLGRMARQGGGGVDRSYWQKSWSADPWAVSRTSRRGFRLACAAVSILGTVEPGATTTALAGDAGIGARLLFAWPGTMPLKPLSDAQGALCPESLRALGRLRDLPSRRRVVPLSPDARAAFEDFRRAHASEGPVLDDVEAAWWGRGPSNVLRLACVLTFLDWAASTDGAAEPAVVSAAALEAAAVLWRGYLCCHAGAVLGALGSSDSGRQANKVLLWIRRRRLVEISREDIRRHARAARDAADADSVIETLVAGRWLRPVDPGQPGAWRPRRRWSVNPYLIRLADVETWRTVPSGVSANAADPGQ